MYLNMPVPSVVFGVRMLIYIYILICVCVLFFLEAMSSLGSRMEAAYYAAPLQLVDQTLPALVRHLRSEGWAVYGATSRRTGEAR